MPSARPCMVRRPFRVLYRTLEIISVPLIGFKSKYNDDNMKYFSRIFWIMKKCQVTVQVQPAVAAVLQGNIAMFLFWQNRHLVFEHGKGFN